MKDKIIDFGFMKLELLEQIIWYKNHVGFPPIIVLERESPYVGPLPSYCSPICIQHGKVHHLRNCKDLQDWEDEFNDFIRRNPEITPYEIFDSKLQNITAYVLKKICEAAI